MREIKFRAILKREHTFRHVWGIDFLNLKVLVSIGGSYEWHHWKILSEFTGLYDKNDVQIFDGDILSGIWHAEIAPQNAVVEYYFNGFCAVRERNPLYIDDFEWTDIKTLEVIGNRWENPELLKEEEDEMVEV